MGPISQAVRWRGQGVGRATRAPCLLVAHLRVCFGLLESSDELEFLEFSWNFLAHFIFHLSCTKIDIHETLLKIASVRVSCIQIMQIRGKTIAKVFGKVDTFGTYQLP